MEGRSQTLRPVAEAPEKAILTGDPGRALFLAQQLLEPPAPMFNHHRGFWGYAGVSLETGEPLLIQGTGVGSPSLISVVTDLARLGVRQFVRVGTATGSPDSALGDMVVSSASTVTDGVSQVIGSASESQAAPSLLKAARDLVIDIARVGPTQSSDLQAEWTETQTWDGILAKDLSTGGLYAAAERLELEALSILVVGRIDQLELEDSNLEAAVMLAGITAEAVLSAA